MKKIPFNPYIVGNPIKNKEMFFGREDDFQHVAKKIGGARSNQVLVFCGDRRSGKTSILFQILGGRLGEAFLPVLIDMQILAGIKDDLHFFRTILKVACTNLKLPGLTLETLEGDSTTPTVEGLFENFLKFIANRFPDKIILFLLDEYEIIEEKIRDGSLSESSIHYLSGALESPYRLSFIFTGSTNLEQRKVSFWKSLLGKSIYRKISYLSPNDTSRLITEPLRDYIRYPERFVLSIYRLTGGQPFYTQVICQNLVDHLMEEERNDPTFKDLESIVKDIIDNPLPQMIYSWNSLSDDIKLLLSSLGGLLLGPEDWADAQGVLSFLKKNGIILPFKRERIHILLEEAYHKEYLEKRENQKYRFRMDLLRRWVQREHSIWKVAKEIGLEFKKRYNLRLIIVSAVLLIAAGITALWFTGLGPAILKQGKTVEKPAPVVPILSSLEEPVEEVEESKEATNVKLMANFGPFRVVIDDSLPLTSEGLDDEKAIVIPTLKRGDHSFVFHNPKSGEEIDINAEINMDSQIIEVEFRAPVIAKKEPREPPLKETKIDTGSIFISSIPPSSLIILDGEDTGLKTPNLFENIKAGGHRITLIQEGFKQQTVNLAVEIDKTAKKEIILIESFGEVLFDVRPTAKILLDGIPLIETPYVKPVKIQTGKHILTIINESLGVKKEIEIELNEGQTIRIQEVLK